MSDQYKLGDYVRIHDHDGAEITVKITDTGIPNRQGDFTFKAGARMFKNSEILGFGKVPVVEAVGQRTFARGDAVFHEKFRHGTVDRATQTGFYEVNFSDYGIKTVLGSHLVDSKFPAVAPGVAEVHAELAAENEAVKHPAHYGGAGDPYEAIKVIEAWDLNFNLGSVLKYVRRAGKKDASKELEDLRKARFYIDHEISRMEQKK